MRSALAWLARLALGLVLLAVLVIALLVVTAHTGWGREQLRQRVEAALREAFPGGARVAALEGSLLGELTLRGVEIDRPGGAPLVAIAVLRVDLALWPLVTRTARVHELVAEDVHVVVSTQVPAGEPSREAAPSAWRIELSRAAIRRASLELDLGGPRLTLADIDATGAATVERGEIAMFGWVHARWRERGAELTAIGTADVGSAVRVPVAQIALGGATIAVQRLAIGPAGASEAAQPLAGSASSREPSAAPRSIEPIGPVSGSLVASVSGPALAALVPELDLSRDAAARLGEIAAAVEVSTAASPSPVVRSGGRDGAAAQDLCPDRRAQSHVAITADTSLERRVEIHATTGAGRLWASLRGALAQRIARGVISVAELDLAAWTAGRWCGRGDAIAALDGTTQHVRGTAIVGGDVLRALEDLDRVRGAPVGPCPVSRADAAHGSGASASAAAPGVARSAPVPDPAGAIVAFGATRQCAKVAVIAGGGEDGQAFAVAAGHRRHDGAFALDEAHAVVRSGAVAVAGRRVTGHLAATASADGELWPSLDVHLAGRATGRAIAAGDLRVAAAQGPFAAQLTPGGAVSEAHVTARGVRSGASEIAAIHADVRDPGGGEYRVAATAWPGVRGLAIFADARVALRSDRIVAQIDRSRVTVPGRMTWDGRGGSVVISDASVALRDVALHSGDATVALRGDLARASGDLVARVVADRLPPSRIDSRYRGELSGALDLAHGRAGWSAGGRLDLRAFAIDASDRVPPLNATADLALARRRLALDVRAGSAELGTAELALDVTAPRDPLDLRAWQALDATAIHKAAITARRVELSSLAALVAPGEGPEIRERVRGTIDGAVDLAPGALRGALAVHGIALPFAVLDGDLQLSAQGGDLGARATARLGDLGVAEVSARFTLPARPFDPATWGRRGRDLLKEARVAVADIALEPRRLASLGLAGPLARAGLADLRGRASAALTLDAAAADARLAIELDEVTGGPFVEPLSQNIAITSGAAGTHAHAALHARELSLGEVDGDLAMTLDQWVDDPAVARGAALTAGWTLPGAPAAPVLALIGRRDLVSGALDASAHVTGTLADPVVAVHLGARDVAIAAPLGSGTPAGLRDIEADASWQAGSASIAVTARQTSGGELRAHVSGATAGLASPPGASASTGLLAAAPGALATATGTLTARHLDIAPLAVLLAAAAPQLPGQLVGAAGILDGDLALAGGRLDGALAVTGGALPIANSVGTLRDAAARIAIDDRALHATVRGRLGRGTIDLVADAATDLSTIDARLKLAGVSPIASLRPTIDAAITAKLQLGAARTCEPGALPARLCAAIAVRDARIALPDHASTPLLDASAPEDLVFVGPARPAAAATAVLASPKPPGGPARAPAHPWLVAKVALAPTPVTATDVAEGISFRATVRSHQLTVSLGDTLGVRGTVDVDHADADVLGRRYIVEPGALEFDDTTDPRLDLRMSHQFSELTLNVAIAGTTTAPRLQLSSDPGGYTYDQLFGFLVGGEPGSETGGAVVGATARLVSGKLGRRVSKVLPIKLDAVSCEPSTSATASSAGSCTFGKWVYERLFLAYRRHINAAPGESPDDIQLQYRVGRNVLLEGSGDRSHIGADVLWRHRW